MRNIEIFRMRRSLYALVLLGLSACSNYVSQEEMSSQLKKQLQFQLDHHQAFKKYDMQVLDLKLTPMSDGVYAGQSHLSFDGHTYPISLLVQVTDQQNYIINIPNDDFGFIDDVELEKYRAQLEQEFQTLVGHFDMNADFDEDPIRQHTIASSNKNKPL